MRWEVLLRTLEQAAEHAYLFSGKYMHFKADLFLGPRELSYLLRQSHSFLVNELGPALGSRLGDELLGECCEHEIHEAQPLLFSLHLVHYRSAGLSEMELGTLEAFVQRVPSGMRGILENEERWWCFQMAVSCSVAGPKGPRAPLFWVTEDQGRTSHTFYGSNMIDGGAL